MCVAVPGRILSVHERDELPMGQVDVRGVRSEACLIYFPEAQPGDWVLVHLGQAIQLLDEPAAQEILAMYAEAGLLEDDAQAEGGAQGERTWAAD